MLHGTGHEGVHGEHIPGTSARVPRTGTGTGTGVVRGACKPTKGAGEVGGAETGFW